MALNYRLRPCVIKLRGNGLHPAGERERGVKAAAGGGAVSSVNYLRFQTRAKRVYTSNNNGNKSSSSNGNNGNNNNNRDSFCFLAQN